MRYQETVAAPIQSQSDLTILSLLRFAGTSMTQQSVEQQKTIDYAISDATNKARIETTRIETRYDMCLRDLEKSKKKCEGLKRENKKLKEENAKLQQQRPPCLPFTRRQQTSDVDGSSSSALTTRRPSSPVKGLLAPPSDELTDANLPILFYGIQENRRFSREAASLVHFRPTQSGPVLVVPETGIYTLSHLLPLLRTTMTKDELELDIANVGVFLRSNCVYVEPSEYQQQFQIMQEQTYGTDPSQSAPPLVIRKGYALDVGQKQAIRFNTANLIQAICSQEIVVSIFRKLPSHCNKSFDTSFRTSPRLLKLLSATDNIDALPLEPPHFSKFFCIPTKVSDGKKVTQGSKKECVVCGSHCTIQIPKNNDREIKLANHIPKQCPFLFITCPSYQAIVGDEYKVQTCTSEAVTVCKTMQSQIALFGDIYKQLRSTIINRYSYFLSRVNSIELPEDYSSTLIRSNGERYKLAELESDITRITDTSRERGLSSMCNYESHYTSFKEHHNSDCQTMQEIIQQYSGTVLQKDKVARNDEIFKYDFQTSCNLQMQGLAVMGVHSIDLYGKPPPPVTQVDTLLPQPMALQNTLLALKQQNEHEIDSNTRLLLDNQIGELASELQVSNIEFNNNDPDQGYDESNEAYEARMYFYRAKEEATTVEEDPMRYL